MSKIIKIAVNSLKGDDTIGGHSGKCRKFWIFDVLDNKIIDKSLMNLERDQTLHHVFHESGNYNHPLFDVDILISGGIGAGAVNRLKSQNIQALITTETNADKAIALLIEGQLPIVANGHDGNCNHDHDHDHHHAH